MEQIQSENQELNKIEEKNLTIIGKAQSYEIKTADDYTAAMAYAVEIKAWRKSIDSIFDPGIKKAHASWKESIATKDKFLEPVEKALSLLDQKARGFRMEQDHKRREAERVAREVQEKEQKRLNDLAEKAKARGDEKKAEQFQAKAEQSAVAVPVAENTVPKVDGIKTHKIWKFKIEDETKLDRTYMKPDEVKIGQVVRATKGTLPIAGIRIWSEDSTI